MSPPEIAFALDPGTVMALLAIGTIAGILNVTGGGGSLLTVPLLVVLGLPSPLANGTNRVALVAQNVASVATFRGGGMRGLRHTWPLLAIAAPGSLVGAWAGVIVPDELFRRVLAVTLVISTILVFVRAPSAKDSADPRRFRPITLVTFAALGFYAGFVQAGIGFLIVFALAGWERVPLVRCHAIKVFFVLVQQSLALPVYAFGSLVEWKAGLVLSVGLAAGGFLGARLALGVGERVLQVLLAGGALLLAVGLFVE